MYNIVLNCQLFKDEEQLYTESFSKVINDCSEGLDIGQLEEIWITEKFTEDVIAFQQKKGIASLGHTTGEFEAVAKVISYEGDSRTKYTIFFQSHFFELLFVEEHKMFAASIIRHELAHIHDFTIRSENFGELKAAFYNDTFGCSLSVVNHLWSEYYADREAAKFWSETNFGSKAESLANLVQKINSEVPQMRYGHGTYSDDIEYWKAIYQMTHQMLGIFGNTYGELHGLLTRIGQDPNLDSKLDEIMPHYFKRIGIELNRMYEIYPDWIGLDEFYELSDIILELWAEYGISSYIDHTGQIKLEIDR